MPVFRLFNATAFFFAALIFLCATGTRGQVAPDYLFLEVVDSKGAPVSGARVEMGEPRRAFRETDEKGTVRFEMPWSREYSWSIFSIVKEGFYPFHDLGISGVRRSREREAARLELLKIPETPAERRALGAEQRKRELMWAAKTDDAAAVRRLLKAGVSANLSTDDLRGVPGPRGVPAIMLAAYSGSGEAVEALLRAGADVRRKDEPWRGILAVYLQSRPLVLRPPPDEAARRELLRRYEKGFAALVKAGADLTATDSNKRDLLMLAALHNYPGIVKLLLARGFAPNAASEHGETVIGLAAQGDWEGRDSKIEVVRLLLDAGAKPDLIGSPARCGSALDAAAGRGDMEVVKALLDKGAAIEGTCGFGRTPLATAVGRGRTAMAQFLIEAGADMNAAYDGKHLLMLAAEKNDAATVKMLLGKGFPVDRAGANGWTALHGAIENYYGSGSEAVLRILLDAGADANRIAGDRWGNGSCYTPLILAALKRNTAAMELLARSKADVNLACSPAGETALSTAIGRNEVETVKKILELGADVKNEAARAALKRLRALDLSSYESGRRDETIALLKAAGIEE